MASLAQRSRALQAENVDSVNVSQEPTNNKEDHIDNSPSPSNSKKNNNSNIMPNFPVFVVGSPSSSFASLPRDNEGFDDLDAYFNRSTTPQKTPNKSNRPKSHQNTPAQSSRPETPLTQRKNASVLLAKPVKMIASKFAERYKKEPRLAVSMSEALEETRERERELEHERVIHDSQDPHESAIEEEDRIQRAKRELEEMSINSFDSTITNNSIAYDNNDTEVHLSTYIKSTLNNVVTEESDNNSFDNNDNNDNNNNNDNNYNNDEYAMPNDDDVLMDRLVEEMLVNDSDLPDPVTRETGEVIKETQEEEPVVAAAVTKAARVKQPRKPRTTGGLTRRPATYLPGAEYSETGQRRSCRLKIEPLRYWANEKVCYGRAEDPSITLPVIVNVIKKPELDDPTFAMGLTRKRRRPVDGNVSKLKAQAFGPDCDVETEVNCYDRPGEEEVRLVALSHHHVQGDPVKDCSFRIHTIFTEGTYMSSGQLIFPPLSQKPTKNSARHALVFYVITGSFRVEINKESFLVGPGAQFHVPRANHYTITHVTEDRSVEGRLFFCHCKDNTE